MQQAQIELGHSNLLLRSDTMLGVCEGIGQDFGFHPNWLRLGLGTGLLWNPLAMVAIYLGLAVLVAATRLVFPVAAGAVPDASTAEPLAAKAASEIARQEEFETDRELDLVAA